MGNQTAHKDYEECKRNHKRIMELKKKFKLDSNLDRVSFICGLYKQWKKLKPSPVSHRFSVRDFHRVGWDNDLLQREFGLKF